jgi:phosphate transport system protein
MKTQTEIYIEEIEEKLRREQGMATGAILDSMKAFEALDLSLASKVKETSTAIEELSDNVEGHVFETIARRQPVAKDLRKLAAYLHVAHSLYRIGRYSYKIAHIVYLSQGLQHYKELQILPRMAQMAKSTVDIAMNALLTGDLSGIGELEELEARMDRETEDMFEEIVGYLRQRQDITRMSLFYILVGRYFERTSDHAFMIAERAIYMVTGKKRKLGLAYRDRKSTAPH